MFFVFSKVLWWLADPVTLSLVSALAGLLAIRRVPRVGRAFGLAGVGIMLLTGIFPVGVLLLRPLEDRFPPPAADAPPPYGVIVLGGAIDDDLTVARGQVALEEGAARPVEAAVLARRFPSAKIVYTGGSAALSPSGANEAAEARDLLLALGVDGSRIQIETRSRNTDENARFTAALLKPQPGQVWWLVTSAFHMPRAMGLFEKAGFDVLAFPVDYHSFGDARDWAPRQEPARGLRLFELSVHEWIGLAAYRLTGKIDSWLPAPRANAG